MAASRDELVSQVRQYELDRLSTNDPKLREALSKLIVQLQLTIVQLQPRPPRSE